MSLRKTFAIFAFSFLAMSAVQAGPVVVMETNKGNITIELNEEKAPGTVKNFLEYVDSGFYEGTIFHRVIKEFMIQGGGFVLDDEGKMKEKDNTREPIKNEAKNGLKNERGAIAMARTSEPHSATAQFFINTVDNENLDYPSFDNWGYAVFGKVIDGMDTVDKIAAVPTGGKFVSGGVMRDVPEEEVIIKSVKRKTEGAGEEKATEDAAKEKAADDSAEKKPE